MAPIVQISRAHAFDAGQRDRLSEQSGALHSDTDHAKTNTIAGGCGLHDSGVWVRIEQDGVVGFRAAGGEEAACGYGASLQKFAAREIFSFFHVVPFSDRLCLDPCSQSKIFKSQAGLKSGAYKNIATV